MWLPGAETTWFSHDPCFAVPTVEWKIKGEVNYSWTETELEQSKLHELYYTCKNLIAWISSVETSNSSERVMTMDIYTAVIKILGKASLISILWDGGCTGWKIILDKNFFPFQGSCCGNSFGTVLHYCGISFSFPCTEVTGLLFYQKKHFQWNHWERVISSAVVASKASGCGIQLPGRTCRSRSWT